MIKFLTQGTVNLVDSQGRSEFMPSDTEQLFRTNLKRQKKSWHYRTQQVSYQLNSEGYRAEEWSQVDWNRSVIVQGCSAAFGIGLAELETVSSCLSRLINRPVINMAIPGGSIYANYHNLVTLLSAGPEYRPAAVVTVWTDWARITRFEPLCSGVDFGNVGSWDRDPLYREWNRSPKHSQESAKIIQRSTGLLLKLSQIASAESSHFDHTAKLFGCHSQQITDRARDLTHPGPETAEQQAQVLFQQLSKQL